MRKYLIPSALALALAFTSGAANAAIIEYNFFQSGPGSVNLGATEVYNSTPAGGPSITASSGFVAGVSSVTLGGVLVGNNRGLDEQGLGVCVGSGNACNNGHFDDSPEIDASTRELVQLAIAPLLSGGYTSFFVNADSATGGELLAIYQSATSGALGAFLTSISSASGNVSISPTLNFLNFIATATPGYRGDPDVLLHSIGASTPTAVPEPASLALFGAGLLGLGLANRRRKKAGAAMANAAPSAA